MLSSFRFALLFTTSLCFFLMGCTTKRPFHLWEPAPAVPGGPPPDWSDKDFKQPRYDPKALPAVAVIEFGENGRLWNCKEQRSDPDYCERDRALAFIKEVRKNAGGREVNVIAFVHGWHHNASPYSENFQNFQMMIKCLNWGNPANDNRYEKKEDEPTICTGMRADPSKLYVGVYIGWRGESINPSLGVVKYLSVLNRRKAAATVAENGGKNGLEQTLLELSKAAKTGLPFPPARFVVVGHSFGGLIVTRIAADLFEKRMSKPLDPNPCDHSQFLIPPFADLVVAINPADSSMRMANLVARFEAKDEEHFCDRIPADRPSPRPFLISLHTTSDSATDSIGSLGLKLAFPLDRSYMHEIAQNWKNRPDLSTFLDDPPTVEELRRTTINRVDYLRNTCYLDQPNRQDLICLGLIDVIHGLKKAAYKAVMQGQEKPVPTPNNPNYATDPYYHGAYELLTAVCAEDWEINDQQWNKKHQFEADFKVDFRCSDPAHPERRELRKKLRDKFRQDLHKYLAFPDEEPGLDDDLLLDIYKRVDAGRLSCGDLEMNEDGTLKPRPCEKEEELDRHEGDGPWNRTPFWTINTSYEILQSHSGLWNTDVFAILMGISEQYPIVKLDDKYQELPAAAPSVSFVPYESPIMTRHTRHWKWPWEGFQHQQGQQQR